MKYISVMCWEPDKAEKVTELFLKWKIPEGFKILAGPFSVLGGNKSITVFESDAESLALVDRYWRNTCHSEIMPVLDSAEIAKMKA